MVPERRAHTPAREVEIMARGGKKLLPAHALDAFKFEVAQELGIPLTRGDNGELTTRDAGAIGGRIGGRMVRILVRYAESSLAGKGDGR
jgi:small acid-soluble spore protein D (minor alpha/beta-type SASP)